MCMYSDYKQDFLDSDRPELETWLRCLLVMSPSVRYLNTVRLTFYHL